jgi:hypothetical protein
MRKVVTFVNLPSFSPGFTPYRFKYLLTLLKIFLRIYNLAFFEFNLASFS